jgi:GNAT superfamily N-acetyltransferase
MRNPADLTFRRLDASAALANAALVQRIYEESYVNAIASGQEFDSVDAFMNRFNAYAANPQLDMVIGFIGDEPVGQTWGWPLTSGTTWWTGLLAEPYPDFTREDGRRTFALSEIMVRQSWTGLGVAHALHDALLDRRPESRATLLAEPENEEAYRAYLKWGWKALGTLRPGWPEAPTFDVLILDLNPRTAKNC